MTAAWRTARKVRIHCPISHTTLSELLKGNLTALEGDPTAAKILAVIRARNPLGDFDLYQGVFEVSFGAEGFSPTDRATPAAGRSGVATLSPTAIITTYIDAAVDDDAAAAVLEELIEAHPWEMPVIEVASDTVRLPRRR